MRHACLPSLALGLFLAVTGCRSSDSAGERNALPPSAPGATPVVRTAKGGSLGQGSAPGSGATATNTPAAVLLPASGRIHSVNQGLRFVVVDYTLGGAPALQSVLSVFRGGDKIGELRLSGPERNGFIAADVIDGFVQVDDEVRIQ